MINGFNNELKNFKFSRIDIVNALVNWELEPLTEKEKATLLNELIEKDIFIYGMDDIESLILEIISE